MNANVANGLLAIDVGSRRVKLGWFLPLGECASESQTAMLQTATLPITASQLPQPAATLTVSHRDGENFHAKISEWLEQFDGAEPRIFLASVHSRATVAVQKILSNQMREFTAADLPICIRVDHPERVGIDRLLSVVAVNRLRQSSRPALVVDLGTACTVDLIASDGAFEGGAIFPGVTLAATALHTGTATLPQLSAEDIDCPPAVVGKSTQAAIASGLYWGMVGAVSELVDRMSRECKEPPQIFITGGEAKRLVTDLAREEVPFRHIPNLVLAGIALAAEEFS